ncbi:MAG: hypothetical protein ABH873_05330 [Candidatus Firestonebacteria bacterium]
MKYDEFKAKVKNVPVINIELLKLLFAYSQQFKNQMSRWQKNGKILKLRKNLYILSNEDRRINPSRLFISHEIYNPSYVSMEYALSFYDLIPEKVTDITCITTKKTTTFENILGKFIYQHIKIDCFAGFLEFKDEVGLTYYMATPEKAVVDFLYFNQYRFNIDYKKTLHESFRFQNTKILDTKRLQEYVKIFKDKKLKRIIQEVKK